MFIIIQIYVVSKLVNQIITFSVGVVIVVVVVAITVFHFVLPYVVSQNFRYRLIEILIIVLWLINNNTLLRINYLNDNEINPLLIVLRFIGSNGSLCFSF